MKKPEGIFPAVLAHWHKVIKHSYKETTPSNQLATAYLPDSSG